MSDFEKRKLDSDFKRFTTKNFERPGDCRNIDQIRFYVQELCAKIEEYECRFNYVPQWAYALLAQYNIAHNSLLHSSFRAAYA
ncbi:MAG: hypothetical protein KF775_18275 [Cyclobacteriaceae bacterium]|nr:hypothetical protein [Cytophagales bacterium]MBX2901604.1 hypothetical protein [Cyclobacteriaceae bacterium]